MIRPIHLRLAPALRRLGAPLLGCALIAAAGGKAAAQAQTATPTSEAQAAQPSSQPPDPQQIASPTVPAPDAAGSTTRVVAVGARAVEPAPDKRHLREAEDAYLAGAKKLEHNELAAAESDFERALKLDPENRNYGIAISVARQHWVVELVQQSSKARQAGDEKAADALLAQARAMDPESLLVAEHSEPFLMGEGAAPQGPAAASGATALTPKGAGSGLAQIANGSTAIAGAAQAEPWKIVPPPLGGAIHLDVENGLKSFHLRGTSADVIRQVERAYGILAVIDDSVEHKQVRFDLDNVNYEQAASALAAIADVFMVPEDSTSVIVAKDTAADRQRLERQLQETILLPGYSTEEVNELALVVKNIFDVNKVSTPPGLGSLVVRAPEDVLGPLNLTLRDLVDSTGEVMVEVKLYDVETNRTTTAGGTIPTAFGVFNVDAAAASLVSANQTLVQQAIAEGLISSTASNLQIAAALLASGLVQSSLLSSTIGVFGNGVTQTGITETGSVTLNLGLNTTDSRTLDDVQLRVEDRQPAVFREGTKYPIVSSTYTTGLSTPASALANQSVNGVNLANLLSQYAGGSSATIPQVTYENLGVTLEATPTIEKSGRINLMLKLSIEALSGSSADGNPILVSRQFSSDLTIGNGESALMASSVTRSEMSAMTGIPGLSELPGFQMPLENNLQKDSTQLVVVVTPHIVRRRSDLVAGPRIAIHFPVTD